MAKPPATCPTALRRERDAVIDAIAKRDLIIDGLCTRDLRDQRDSYPCAVENLRAALIAAYEAGRRQSRRKRQRAGEERHGDLVITSKPAARAANGWVEGSIGTYRFTAKVYPEHARFADYEIGRSRISKLRVCRLADDAVVYAWDRGLDIPAADADAQAAVDALSERLVDHVFGPANG